MFYPLYRLPFTTSFFCSALLEVFDYSLEAFQLMFKDFAFSLKESQTGALI
jgi:hypothetical protein